MECGVCSVKYSVESKVVKCGVQRMACGGWTVEYGVWRVKCIKCSVLCVCVEFEV